MEIVRYVEQGAAQPRVGVRRDGKITPVRFGSVAALWREPLDALRAGLEPSGAEVDAATVTYLPPVDGRTEVWASGVTYERSREGRVEESIQASIYELVYDAPRPELFLKAVAWRGVTDGEPGGGRAESEGGGPE